MSSTSAPPPRKGPKPATPERLEKSALAYLERFSTSAAHLRRVLMRRVDRSVRAHGTDREAGAAFVDKLIERYGRAGLLDDQRFAEGRVASLRRRGASAQQIRGKLAAKGVASQVIDTALTGHADGAGRAAADDDFVAAIAFARRRRLGPFRTVAAPTAEARAAARERDLAALGRAGFGYELARRVVEAESVEALESEAGECETGESETG